MNIKKIIKGKYVWVAGALVIVIVASYFIFNKSSTGLTQIKAEKKDVTQEVLASGKTKAVDSVDLGFEKSGKVTMALVDVGSRVVAGQTLVELDNSELLADLLKAQASLSEEMAGNATDVVAISDASANARAVIADSFTKADNVVRSDVDQFFIEPDSVSPNFKPSVQDSSNNTFYFSVDFSAKTSINENRRKLQSELSLWKTEIASLSENNVDDVLKKSEAHLSSVKSLVDEVSLAIFAITVESSDFTTAVSGYKTDMSTARTTINTALSNLISAREKLNTALAKDSVSVSGGTAISAKQAKILQLQADIQNIQSQISKTRLTAPFAGIVTKQDVEKGEIVGAGTVIVSIISDDKLEIESNISEVNIGKIIIGNSVSITLDAYPGQTFTGTVSYIDPGETIIDGVVNYKIKIAFNVGSSTVKSGLTANLNIETAKKTGVVSIPLFAVTKKGDKNFVKKVVGDSLSQDVEVSLGIVAQDGSVEIVSGLSEGDTIEVGAQ